MKSKPPKSKNQFQELLSRGVEEIIDKANLEKKLKSGKTLRVKLGIDPTSPNIHLGRTIPLLKLRDFQALGHKIVFIVGDFTGTIGDTSDKESERPMLSEETIQANLKTYISQIEKIIDVSAAEIRYNSEWLGKLNYAEIGRQADVFSLNDFIARENIKKRLDLGKRVSLRELLYPLMQGYDSVRVKSDVEVGGTDQRFNLLTGRDLQRSYGQEPQDVIINPLIPGLDGRKMSSSFGNTINIFDAPNDMFGKVMSAKDDLIIKYFTFLTRVEMPLIQNYESELKNGANPRGIKLKLASEIVRMYHSAKAASDARNYFVSTFTHKNIPSDLPEFKPSSYELISVLVESKIVPSKSEARRVLKQKGIKINGKIIEEESFTIPRGATLQKGKIHFLKIV